MPVFFIFLIFGRTVSARLKKIQNRVIFNKTPPFVTREKAYGRYFLEEARHKEKKNQINLYNLMVFNVSGELDLTRFTDSITE